MQPSQVIKKLLPAFQQYYTIKENDVTPPFCAEAHTNKQYCRPDSNRQPPAYKADALTVELRQQKKKPIRTKWADTEGNPSVSQSLIIPDELILPCTKSNIFHVPALLCSETQQKTSSSGRTPFFHRQLHFIIRKTACHYPDSVIMEHPNSAVSGNPTENSPSNFSFSSSSEVSIIFSSLIPFLLSSCIQNTRQPDSCSVLSV